MFGSFVSLLDRSIGRCPRCMHTAFLAALGAWVLAFAATALGGAAWLTASLLFAAFGLTALWLAHIGTFAIRATMAGRRATGDPAASDTMPASARAPFSRRRFAAEVARAAVFAAAATALSVRATTVLAANCDCSKCSTNQVCCHTANGSCGCFPAGIKC